MLYKPEHRQMILERTKTETRRLSDRRPARPGVVRGFYTRIAIAGGKPFCRAEILEVEREPLGKITQAGCVAEGYPHRSAYIEIWQRINGEDSWLRDRERLVWVVRFELIEQLGCCRCGDYGGLDGVTDSVALFCEDCRAIDP